MSSPGQPNPRFTTPLRRTRGFGTAHAGTGHFWQQRLTAVANVPLVIAFVVIVVSLLGRNHAAVVQIVGSPFVAIILMLFVVSVTWHMRIGMQVIIEDYVHSDLPKLTLLLANTFFTIAVALGCIFAILKLSFGV